MADDDAANRARDEADRVGAEGIQRAGERIGRGKQAVEDERRRRTVEEGRIHSMVVPIRLAKATMRTEPVADGWFVVETMGAAARRTLWLPP